MKKEGHSSGKGRGSLRGLFVREEVVDLLPDLNNTDPLTTMMNEPEGTNPNDQTRIQPSATYDGDTAQRDF